jgi:glutathione peroxidase
VNHGVTFPLVKKSEVNGDNTNEVYRWLKSEKAGILGLTRIKVCIRDVSVFQNPHRT